MRSAEHTGADPGGVPLVSPLTRVRQAADSEQYWVLAPESMGRWSLRLLDDTTGVLGEPRQMSGSLADLTEAFGWASPLVGGIHEWRSLATHPGAVIEEAYYLVRALSYRTRPGRHVVAYVRPDEHNPALHLVDVRERWTEAGVDGSALAVYERGMFDDEQDLLSQLSRRFGLDPAGWITVTAGEYHHHQPWARAG